MAAAWGPDYVFQIRRVSDGLRVCLGVRTKIRRASGPRRVRSRLRCFVMLPMLGTRGPAILGVYRIPPRAKRGAAWGGSAAPGPAFQGRRSPVEVPSKPRRVPESYKRASQNYDRIWNGFWTPKCSQKYPKMVPKTFTNLQKFEAVFD